MTKKDLKILLEQIYEGFLFLILLFVIFFAFWIIAETNGKMILEKEKEYCFKQGAAKYKQSLGGLFDGSACIYEN